MCENKKLFDVGSMKPSLLYDIATFLSVAELGFDFDMDSEFYQVFHCLAASAWAAVPDALTIVLREALRISR